MKISPDYPTRLTTVALAVVLLAAITLAFIPRTWADTSAGITTLSFLITFFCFAAGIGWTINLRERHLLLRGLSWAIVSTLGFSLGFANELVLNGAPRDEWPGAVLLGLVLGVGGAGWETYLRYVRS
jgi:hypothetical protein